MTIPPGLENVLSIDPEIMHGSLCFSGTRIPLTVFLDNLAEGMGLDEFLTNYPTVSREQVLQVIHWEHEALRTAAGLQKAG